MLKSRSKTSQNAIVSNLKDWLSTTGKIIALFLNLQNGSKKKSFDTVDLKKACF